MKKTPSQVILKRLQIPMVMVPETTLMRMTMEMDGVMNMKFQLDTTLLTHHPHQLIPMVME